MSTSSASRGSNAGTSTNVASLLVAGAVLVCVALSLGLMGIFYVIRNRRLEWRRWQQQQQRRRRRRNQLVEPNGERRAEAAAECASAGESSPPVVSAEHLIDEDISNGREPHKLPAVSYRSSDRAPADFHYVTEHVQCEPGIHVDTRLTSMQSCNCVDDCAGGNCECSRASACKRFYAPTGHLAPDYNFKSAELIRECNSACKCNRSACTNMVVQRGCRARLSLFRTRSRGWGVVTLEHLKRGTFVGVYSGELVSVESSQRRQDDTYLFNLARNPRVASTGHALVRGERSRRRRNKRKLRHEGEEFAGEGEEVEEVGEVEEAAEVAEEVAVAPQACDSEQQCEQASEETGCALVDGEHSTVVTTSSGPESLALEPKPTPDQQEAPADEATAPAPANETNYICDAKFYGNFTRFINHSCEPNVTGIRTHTVHQDDRFPHIAFFTNQDVPAGRELTLNYGDSYWLVKCTRDKVYCLCKATKCKFNRRVLPATLAEYGRK